jgi:hypothetical protein
VKVNRSLGKDKAVRRNFLGPRGPKKLAGTKGAKAAA